MYTVHKKISQMMFVLEGMSCIVNATNDNDWVHRNYVCLLVKETDWIVSLHSIFFRFFF